MVKTVIICDKCGKEMRSQEAHIDFVTEKNLYVNKEIDLCVSCARKFCEFMNMKMERTLY